MDRSTVITLVGAQLSQDAYGVWHSTPTRRNVFAQVDSVTRAEFFEAGRNGFNPEFRFTMFFADYEGEDTVVYNDQPYGIYRTYRGRTDTIELYAERKGGNNGTLND